MTEWKSLSRNPWGMCNTPRAQRARLRRARSSLMSEASAACSASPQSPLTGYAACRDPRTVSRPWPSLATFPLREVRVTRLDPWSRSHRAVLSPSPPRPPVMRQLARSLDCCFAVVSPSESSPAGAAAALVILRNRTTEQDVGDTEHCGSSMPCSRLRAVVPPSTDDTSTRRVDNVGCSSAITRSNPHTPAGATPLIDGAAACK
mmetsp:Transcript_85851/g.257189  ORF Transcript_85851/g.257189 Transcript_85851/m.257189 type:complete len:204 (+) Transcript_85851:1078-1689(+)